MRVGSFGSVVFSVSPRKIETFKNLKRSGSVSFSEHKRHNGKSILEFTGINSEDISFSVTLSTELGIDVEKEIEKIIDIEKKGTAQYLVIGKKIYGKFVLTKHSVTYKFHDKRGTPVVAELSLTLKEYNK